MQRITSATAADLYSIAATRRIEQAAATLGPHCLMQRAGLALARLAMAVAPHARSIWIACGPGNNGGDGFEAAAQLQQRGLAPVVTWIGDESRLPADARASLQRARAVGVPLVAAPPDDCELVIDALLGLGSTRAPQGQMLDWLLRMYAADRPLLAVDTPSGLDADTGTLSFQLPPASNQAPRFCLSLLTLKPGLFTAQGRDATGEVWFDNLGVNAHNETPAARLPGAPDKAARRQSSHKGSFGDVAIIGGAPGMAGAALLAATAALTAGAGRVFVAALDPQLPALDGLQPELMFRRPESLDLRAMTLVCGCGGGSAVASLLPRVLRQAHRLVLDADALNAIATDPALETLLQQRGAAGHPTVLTPHPLEAARLLHSSAAQVQANRFDAAAQLAARFGAVVVLKGSGTVIAQTGQITLLNPSGNARLATAGTGDVLAGMIGAALAAGQPTLAAACAAVWTHGNLADHWPSERPLTAGALARRNPS